MVTLFEENIKTVACTTWNERKQKYGVQTPAADATQGRIHQSEVKKREESEGSATLLQPSRTFLHHGAAHHGGDGRPGQESH